MANAKNDKGTTDLATRGNVQLGKLRDDAAFADFIGEGFASIETVIFGSEEEGKCQRYVGVLLGGGAPINRTDDRTGEVSSQKTYAFHPMTKDAEGNIGSAVNVTHVIPASYMMAAALDRIVEQSKATATIPVVGMLWRGQVRTRRGFMVNDVGIWEKYMPAPKAAT